MKIDFSIKVRQLTVELMKDDIDSMPAGEDGKGSTHTYHYDTSYTPTRHMGALNESGETEAQEVALDYFHERIGISCLEDFDISIERINYRKDET